MVVLHGGNMNKKIEKLIENIRDAEGVLDRAKKALMDEISSTKIDFSDFEPDDLFYDKPNLQVEILSGGELAISDDFDNANYIDKFIEHKGKVTYKEYRKNFLTGFI